MTRRAITVRVLIFVPLLAYFGYGAYQKWRNERAEASDQAAAASARDIELKGATKSVVLNDGRSIDIVELTPEQAERHYGIKLPPEDKTAAPVKPMPEAPATVEAPKTPPEPPAPAAN